MTQLTTNLDQITTHIQSGGIAVIPTDTTYGLTGLYGNQDVIKNIANLKQRDAQKPFIAQVSSIEQAEKLAEINDKQLQILQAYWPGPISFILDTQHKDQTIALRWMKSLVAQNICQKVDHPLITTSVNQQGEPPCTTIAQVQNFLENRPDILIYDQVITATKASTLVDLTKQPYQILRQGQIKFTDI